MSSIYGLVDPVTGQIRYVGKTSKDPIYRLQQHIWSAVTGSPLHVHNWIRTLDKEPSFLVLEQNPVDPDEAERRWIASLRLQGVKLTNMTEGGDGFTSGFVFTPEHRRKISEALRGNTHGRGRKGIKGKKHSQETIEIIRASSTGRLHTEATKEKIRLTHTGMTGTPHTEDWKRQNSIRMKRIWAERRARR